ncbi:MAG: 3-methyl-2-oxobutanoate hydroxymethyltransferase [Gemmatimonadales bacterium]
MAPASRSWPTWASRRNRSTSWAVSRSRAAGGGGPIVPRRRPGPRAGGGARWSSNWCRPRWRPGCPRPSRIPTIGIGAGPGCDGQVLVLHDMLGLNEGFTLKFLEGYADLSTATRDALGRYAEVRGGQYPGPEHSHER